MRYPLTLCLLLAATCAIGDTYRWTDSGGRTVVSDTPPSGKVKNFVKNGATAEPSDGLNAGPLPITNHYSPITKHTWAASETFSFQISATSRIFR